MEKILASLPEVMRKEVDRLKEKYHIEVNHGQVSYDLFGIHIVLENFAIKPIMDEYGDKYSAARDLLREMFELNQITGKSAEMQMMIIGQLSKIFHLCVDQDETDFDKVLTHMLKALIDPEKLKEMDAHWIFDVVKIADYAYYLGHRLIMELGQTLKKVRETGDMTPIHELIARDILPYQIEIADNADEARAIMQKIKTENYDIDTITEVSRSKLNKTIGNC